MSLALDQKREAGPFCGPRIRKTATPVWFRRRRVQSAPSRRNEKNRGLGPRFFLGGGRRGRRVLHAIPISIIERKRAQGRRRGRRFFRSLPIVSICPLFCPACLPTPQPIAPAGASIGKISEAARTPCLVGGSFPPNGEESKNGKPANHVDLKKHCETLTPFLLRPSLCASPKKNNPDYHNVA